MNKAPIPCTLCGDYLDIEQYFTKPNLLAAVAVINCHPHSPKLI